MNMRSAPALAAEEPDLQLVQHERILIRENLLPADLIALMRNQVVAIRFKKFFAPELCEQIVQRLMGSSLYGKYVNAPAIARIGKAYFECQADEEILRRYREDAVAWVQELRDRSAPYLTPFDRFRVELDEGWLAGAYLATLNKRKAFGGLVRHFGAGSEAEPHMDVLHWDDATAAASSGIIGQLAWNTYLTMPSRGGNLTIWDLTLSREQYEEYRIANSYGLKREHLPAPIVSITPEVGEMILFNAGRVHAVEEIKAGSRVSWSCFVGYRDVHDPLLIWS